MRILIVTATVGEIAPLVERLGEPTDAGPRVTSYTHRLHNVDVLVTGVGMVATAAWCSKVMAQRRYDLGLNLGVCGSFDPALEPGAVVHVVADRIAELGAEDDDAFLTVQELKLLGENEFPFAGGRLVNVAPPSHASLTALPAVEAITVNTVHGSDRSIAAATARFNPQVESMEGAAFMYACLIHELAFAQIRAVSNVVERRNREAWKMTDAIGRLGDVALELLDHA